MSCEAHQFSALHTCNLLATNPACGWTFWWSLCLYLVQICTCRMVPWAEIDHIILGSSLSWPVDLFSITRFKLFFPRAIVDMWDGESFESGGRNRRFMTAASGMKQKELNIHPLSDVHQMRDHATHPFSSQRHKKKKKVFIGSLLEALRSGFIRLQSTKVTCHPGGQTFWGNQDFRTPLELSNSRDFHPIHSRLGEG